MSCNDDIFISSAQEFVTLDEIEALDQLKTDYQYMRMAIDEGLKGRFTTAPNPWVGCVIVSQNDSVLGVGHHQKAGQAHAEVRAIEDAIKRFGEDAARQLLRGATAYVTLEPCTRTPTKRTGPCDELLIKYKLDRVVIGLVDPDERITARGIATLRAAGIQVDTNVLEDECAASLRPYLKHRRTGLPWVTLKMAQSLDAKIANADASPLWLSGEASLKDVHTRWRASAQAIVVGANTARRDNPLLTVRHYDACVDTTLIQPPLRVVIGSANCERPIELKSHLLDTHTAPTLVFIPPKFEPPQIWFDCSVQTCVIDETDDSGHLSFTQILKELGRRGVLQVLVEGGALLTASLLDTPSCVDAFVVYMASTVLGGDGLSWGMSHKYTVKPKLQLERATVLGNDVCLEYLVNY